MPNVKAGLILGYKHFFKNEPPKNRIDLLKSISKVDLITELAGTNYRIKPPTKIFFDNSVETDIKELSYHLRTHPDICNRAIQQYRYHLKNTSTNSLIFNRASMLFALNEIIKNDELKDIEDYVFTDIDQINIFKYMLLINDEITKFESEIFNVDSYSKLEKLNLAILPLNEYYIPIDPLLTFCRAGSLFKFLEQTEYKDSLKEFFETNTNLTPQKFLYEVAGILMTRVRNRSILDIIYVVEKESHVNKLFNYLSIRRNIKDSELEFLDIKKSPFFYGGENRFIMLDNMFLSSLTYDFFIWNFYFDYLKKKGKTKEEQDDILKEFKGVIGQFNEHYLKQIIENIASYKNYYSRVFNQLKFKINKEELELADVYIRQKNKVIIGEAKTTSIINEEKYASSVNDFYDSDPEKFFDKHGLVQLFKWVKYFIQYHKLIDKGLVTRGIKLYPTLFFNDPLLNNPFFPKIFSSHFSEMLKELDIPTCVKIFPLTMIHISDIEILKGKLTNSKKCPFKLIRNHIDKYNNEVPFHYTSNERDNREYSKRIFNFYHELIKEQGGKS